MLLNFEQVSHSYGERLLLDGVTFYLKPGDRLGLVGVNGCGKSTLLKIAARQLPPDSGSVSTDPNVRVNYLTQTLRDTETNTALEQVLQGQDPAARQVLEYEAVELLTRLGIPDRNAKIGTLSGGQRKRVALAQCLVSPCDVLILDEPTNHLDISMIGWLEEYLSGFAGAILFVSHDRYFLERMATETAELSFGRFFLYEGGYSAYLNGKARREEMEAASERKRQATLRRELIWVLQGPCARGTKSRERLERYAALKAQLPPETESELSAIRTVSSRLGKKTISLSDAAKVYGAKTVLSHVDFLLQRDDRVGIVGLNGAGKSTLLNLISGRLAPDSGSYEAGETVKIGYFTQHSDELDGNMTGLEYVSQCGQSIPTMDGNLTPSKLMELFLFPGSAQHRKISLLSGGEKRRLFLLGILASAPNVLLLDEPTNDLDIPTLQVLETYLETFPGAIVAVSHDRYFLDRICTRLMILRPGEPIQTVNGGDTERWLRELSAPVKERKAPKSPVSPPASKPQKLRFSFKEQREFDAIDGEIAELETRLAENRKAQEAAAADYVRLQELMAAQQQLEAALEEKTERWIYLTEKKEQIDAQS